MNTCPIYSMELFTFHKESNSLITEASTIDHVSKYGDSFAIKSTKTGKVVHFYKSGEVRTDDEDYELLYETFRPTDASIRDNPGIVDLRVEVFND